MEALRQSIRYFTHHAIHPRRAFSAPSSALFGAKKVQEAPAQPANDSPRVALGDHLRADNGFNRYLIKAEVAAHPTLKTGHATLDFSQTKRADAYRYANSAGALHGGAIAALHDFAGCEVLSARGLKGATASLMINFYQPINLKDLSVKIVSAIAHTLFLNERSAMVRSELVVNDQIVGDATMRFAIAPVEESKTKYHYAPMESSLDHSNKTKDECSELPEQLPENQAVG